MNNRSTGVRVLFAGDYWPGSNTVYIAKAFEGCGAIVRFMNDVSIFPHWHSTAGKSIRRMLWKTLVEYEWNYQFLNLLDSLNPDLVYISNGHLCWPKTLTQIRDRSIPVMCFYHDPPWKSRRWSHFRENIPYFDLIATTREWHRSEFESAGAKAVTIVRFGYEPLIHRPIEVEPHARDTYGADITFVGSYRKLRESELTALMSSNMPYTFRIWGGGWNELPQDSPIRSFWQGREVYETEIPVIYASSKIALHWVHWEPEARDEALRKGDQHNSRTFQIPACGGAMMVAQRTDEHLGFFTENVEAVYFDDVAELRDKLRYWLDPAHDEARQAIAAAARARCLREDYSYLPIVKGFLKYFNLPYNEE